MPLGDSITYGFAGAEFNLGGYWPTVAAGLPGLTPLGSLFNGIDWNEGHSSATSADILSNIATYWAANPTQIVLLHLGTNDQFLGGSDAASAALSASNISDIVDYIHQQNSSARIYVARIINARSDRVSLNTFIGLQQTAVAAAMAGKSWVTMMTMPALTDPQFADDVHPNNGSGYPAMGAAWIAALQS